MLSPAFPPAAPSEPYRRDRGRSRWVFLGHAAPCKHFVGNRCCKNARELWTPDPPCWGAPRTRTPMS